MAVIETTHESDAGPSDAPAAKAPGQIERLLGTGDHTSIGRVFIACSIFFIIVSLLSRALVGIDIATDNSVLGESIALLSRSGLVALVFLGVIPLLLGLAIIVVPLQVGSPAIAFPRAAELALWSWVVFALVFLLSAVLDGGVGGQDLESAKLGNVALGAVMVALGLAAVCVATTVLAHRPAGMTLARIPLFSWSMLVASSIWIVSFGSAVAWSVIAHLGSKAPEDFLTSFTDGLGWLLRGPAVLMLAIPLLGVAGDVVAVAARRPLRHYGLLQACIGFFGIMSFGAWAPSVDAVETVMWALFAIGATIALIGFTGGLLASINRGSVRLTAGLVGSLLALSNLFVAVALGLIMATNTIGDGTVFGFDVVALGEAQTIFVATAVLVGVLAALAHWSVKVWGAESSGPRAERALLAVDLGGLVLGLTWSVELFVNGADGTSALPVFGTLSAIGALLMLAGVILGPRSSAGSAGEGGVPEDPYGGLTLEWQTPSPAVGGERTVPIPAVSSPYPLYESALDKEGN